MSIRHCNNAWTVLFCMLLTLQSCSVKEDRMDCPCYLTVDLSNCDKDVQTIVTELGNDYSMKQNVSEITNEDDSIKTYKVKKGLINICAYSGLIHMQYHNHKLLIPKGYECDPIMAYSSTFDCTKDKTEQQVSLKKQYANLKVEFIVREDKVFSNSIRIKGNYSGFNLLNLEPAAGEFIYMPKPKEKKRNIFEAKLPRQADNSLTLEILSNEDIVDIIPIGEKISAQGYSWTDENLKDIYLKIDFTRAEIHVTVLPWKEEKDKDVSL